MKIKIQDESYTKSEHEDKEYGDWSSETSHNITGAVKVTKDEYFDLETNNKFLGKYVFLLYILYSDGDSFGSGSGNIEYIDVFEKYDNAEKVAQIIKDDYEKNPDWNFDENGMDLFYIKENGNKGKIPTDIYKGHFASLESVNIQKMFITTKHTF